jgi:predicted nucleic acid-binding protein
LKISRIGLISKLGRIQITIEVYEELSKCRYLIKSLVYEIQQGNIGLAESSDYSRLQKKYQRLGIGELSVIASAKQKIAFIEDRDAENAAKEEGLKVYNIP